MDAPQPAEFRQILFRAIALPVVLAVAVAGVFLWQVHTLLSVTGWVEHTDQVLTQAHTIQSLLVDQETGLRGFLLTGDVRFLEPSNQAQPRTLPALEALTIQVRDNPLQVERLRATREHYRSWLDYAQPLQAARSGSGAGANVVVNTQGKALMDRLRHDIQQFVETEEGLREKRIWKVRRTTQGAIAAGLLLSVVLGAVLTLFIRNQMLRVSGTYSEALTEAESATERHRRVQQVTDTALSHLRLPVLLDELLLRIAEILRADTAVVLLLEAEGTHLEVYAAHGVGQDSVCKIRIPVGEGFAGRIALERRVLAIKDPPPDLLISPGVRARGVRSLLGVPLQVEGRLIGVVHVGVLQPRGFTEEETQLLQVVADRIALAIDHARLFEQVEGQAGELERQVGLRTAELEAANSELESFAYSVSHDLRAPLRAVHGFADALAEDYHDQFDAEGREYLAALSASADRMDRLIEDLLAYSRLSRVELSPQPVQLEAAVAEALMFLPADVRSYVAVEKPLPSVLGHRPTLVQVLLNLLGNAVKFVPPEVTPSICLRSELRGDWARVWVEDNGIGIELEHQERIFRVFERLHGVEAYPGTGIGLAIVRRGLERMGGRSGVESEPGHGSRFWIELPRVRVE